MQDFILPHKHVSAFDVRYYHQYFPYFFSFLLLHFQGMCYRYIVHTIGFSTQVSCLPLAVLVNAIFGKGKESDPTDALANVSADTPLTHYQCFG